VTLVLGKLICYFEKKAKNPSNLNWTGGKTIYVLILLFNFLHMSIFDEKTLVSEDIEKSRFFF